MSLVSCLRSIDVFGQLFDVLCEVSHLCLKVGLLLVSSICGALVRVQLRDAPIAFVHLVFLLGCQLCNHLVNESFDLCERRQLRRGCQQGHLWGARQARTTLQNGNHLLPTLFLAGGLLQEHWGLLLVKSLEGFVAVQNLDGVSHSIDLCQAVLGALVEVSIHSCTLLLQAREEFHVHGKLPLGIFQLLVFLCKLLLGLCNVSIDGHNQLPAGGEFVLLCRLQRLELGQRLGLGLLSLAEVDLEVLLHLTKDSKNLTTLGSVALHARNGQEGGSRLSVVQERPEHADVGLPGLGAINHLRHASIKQSVRCGAQLCEGRVVLSQDDDGVLRSGDGFNV